MPLYPNQPQACQNSNAPDEIMDIIMPRTKQAANITNEINAAERMRLFTFAGSRGYIASEGSTAFPEAAAMVF